MSTVHRREVLRQLVSGLLQAGGAVAVVLVSGSVRADIPGATGEEKPLPVLDPNQQQPTENLQDRVEKAAGELGEVVPGIEGEEDSWINAGFRNVGFNNGGFRNSGFLNGGGGGGFRNGGFVNGGGGGSFRNGSFRNW